MRQRIEKNISEFSTIFKYCYIIHIILAGTVWFVNSPVLRITSTVVLILGSITILYRIANIKNNIKYPFIGLYILFLLSYMISSVTNIQYGWFGNMKIIIWMIFQFGILYLFDLKNDNLEKIYKELNTSLKIIICLTFIQNMICLIMLLGNYFNYYEPKGGKRFLIGIAYWGRLYGIHTDPNYGSILAVISVFSAIYLMMRSTDRLKRFLLCLSLIPQIIFIFCSASRTGLVTFCVCSVTFTFILSYQKYKKKIRSIALSLLVLIAVLSTDKLIIEGYNIYVHTSLCQYVVSLLNFDSTTMIELGRDGELDGDLSNRRFDLWNNAIEVAETSPVIGVSFGNIVEYSKKLLPECYLLTNGFIVFNAFHNMFMDLLASQGIIGFILFLMLIIMSLRFLIVNLKNIPKEEQLTCTFLFSCCTGMLASSLFVSEILYVNNQVTVLFWCFWGFLIFFFQKNKK